jgi:hypothetical protein
MRVGWIFDEGRVDFYKKNLRASLFNKGPLNEPNFGQIHLAGQYFKYTQVDWNNKLSHKGNANRINKILTTEGNLFIYAVHKSTK